MLEYNITVNTDEVSKWLSSKDKKLTTNLPKEINLAIKVVEGSAKEATPIDTSALFGSLQITKQATHYALEATFEVTPKTNSKSGVSTTTYGIYQERGTSRGITGKRFMLKGKVQGSNYLDKVLPRLLDGA